MGSNKKQTASCGEAMSKIYSGPMFDGWNARSPHLAPHEARLLDAHCPHPDALGADVSVLNIGCGNGRETFAVYDAGIHNVRGVDITPEFVAMANERSRKLQLDIEFSLAPADHLPYPDDCFSVLTMFENLYGHVTPRSARRAVLAEARRVLRPGGMLLIEATNIYHSYRCFLGIRMAELWRHVYNPCRLEQGDWLLRGARRVPLSDAELPRSHWFRPGEIEFDAEQARFEVVQVSTVKAIMRDPSANATHYHREGRFLYALRKPADELPANDSETIKFPR